MADIILERKQSRAGTAEVIARLSKLFGPRLSTSNAVLEQHGAGEAMADVVAPDAVVFAQSTSDVAQAVRIAAEHGVPVIAYGAGTSLEGHLQAVEGGISIDLSQMTSVVDVSAENLDCRVQAGVTREALNEYLRDSGLFFPVDPGANATIGGMAATRASGTNAVRYGTMRELVLGLTVVTPQGEVIHTGGRARKSASGYDLTRLYLGSEGTLGVITEVQLRLFGIPEHVASAVCQFETLDGAGQAVSAILAAGILPVAIEMMDKATINAVEDYLGMGLPREAEALLIIEQDGADQALTVKDIERIADLCKQYGSLSVRTAEAEADRLALWGARRAISGALGRLGPNKLGEDIVVPRSRIAEMVRRVGTLSKDVGLPIVVFGHAGDGNLHPNIIFDRRREGELQRVEQAATGIFKAALELGGTLSGEHGIGTLKREFLADDMGPDAVEVMRGIKRVLDPKWLLNPHKVFPEGPGGEGHPGFLTALPSLEGITPG